MALDVLRVPVLSDNYVWLIHDAASRETVVVDPAVAEPVLEAAGQRGWRISQIWNTHWHPDHIGGNAAIQAATGCTITAPAAEAARIPVRDRLITPGETVQLGGHVAQVLDVGGHTLGHIAYWLADERLLFCGDALFAMGCGRLFEGTPDQMWASLSRLAALPDDAIVHCAHEYTLSNGRFALTVEPENAALAARMAQVQAARAQGQATVPFALEVERATNPFLRAGSVDEFARRRTAKDGFRG
jgi:hydroxyacylglutathione hydrolase